MLFSRAFLALKSWIKTMLILSFGTCQALDNTLSKNCPLSVLLHYGIFE